MLKALVAATPLARAKVAAQGGRLGRSPQVSFLLGLLSELRSSRAIRHASGSTVAAERLGRVRRCKSSPTAYSRCCGRHSPRQAAMKTSLSCLTSPCCKSGARLVPSRRGRRGTAARVSVACSTALALICRLSPAGARREGRFGRPGLWSAGVQVEGLQGWDTGRVSLVAVVEGSSTG